MSGIDVGSVISSIQASANEQAAIRGEQSKIAGQSADALSQISESILGVSKQKYQGELDAQNAAIAERNALGNNPQDPNSVLAILTQDFRETAMQAREQRKKVAELSSVGLFDSPLEFLANQILLPDEKNKLAALDQTVQNSVKTISDMQHLTTASAQAQQATKRVLTQELMADQMKIDAADLQLKVNKIKLDGLGYDVEAVKALEHGDVSKMDYTLRALSAQNASETLQLHRESAAREAAKWDQHMKEMQADEAAQDRVAKVVSAGAAALGLPELSDWKEIKYRLKSGTPEQKAQIQKLYEQGVYTATSGSTALGRNTGEAILNTLAVKGMNDPGSAATKEWLRGITGQAFQEWKASNPTAKWDTQAQAAVEKLIQDKLYGPMDKTGKRQINRSEIMRLQSNVETPGNIYKAPDLPQLADLPSVKSSVIYEAVIAPMVAAGITDSSVKSVISQTMEAKKRGLITMEQAALGISQLYSSAVAVNYASKNMGKFMLPYQPQYIAEVPSAVTANPWANDRVDFAKTGSVLNYLVNMEANIYRTNKGY